MLELPPLSLYVHIPWCIRKCPYCDFNSHGADTALPEQAYVDALIKDLKADLPYVQDRKLHSIFFGGGTPSLFSAHAIDNILTAAHQCVGFAEEIEITLEANPGTFEQQKFADFLSAGINRISIGVQSFNQNHLQALGRIHDSNQAKHAIAQARSVGFEKINIDLMHGLPNQNSAQALSDIASAIQYGANHISWYQLTLEPNSAFFSKPPALPTEDKLAEIQQAGLDELQQRGFVQYEVSAFAEDGNSCYHNINYWQFGDYLGIGAGAHGKISLPHCNQVIRTSKTRQPDHYLAKTGSALVHKNPVAAEDLALEFMMNALRLKQGVPATYFAARTGLSQDSIDQKIQSLQAEGLLLKDSSMYCTSQLGYKFLNSLLQRFS